MSYTVMYAFYNNDKIETISEYPNSWLSAPLVWKSMCNKYLGNDNWFYHIEEICNLYKNNIPKYEKAVLLMTMDFSIIKQENFKQASSDIKTFFKNMPNISSENHMIKIADFLENNTDVPAVTFLWSSISHNVFVEYNDKDEMIILWNSAWEIYEELNLM